MTQTEAKQAPRQWEEPAVEPRRPVLSYAQMLWLRDIMRDAGCVRIEREVMERYVDGEGLLDAAEALGRPKGECVAQLFRCRAKLQPYYSDVFDIMLAAAGAMLGCLRNPACKRSPGSGGGDERDPTPEQVDVAETWQAWVFEGSWE